VKQTMQKDLNIKNYSIGKILINKYIKIMAITMSVFHLYTAGTLPFDVFIQRSIHLMFVFSIIFILYPFKKDKITAIDIIATLLGVATCIYVFINYEGIRMQSGLPVGIQYIIGILTTLLILEACRRTIGLALPILAILFILYIWFFIFNFRWYMEPSTRCFCYYGGNVYYIRTIFKRSWCW